MGPLLVKRREAMVSVLASAAAALMPKCPLCLVALAGALGLELPVGPALLPFRLLLVAIAAGVIARMSIQRRRRAPVLLAAAATLLAAAGPLTDHGSVAASRLAMLAMISAALWAAWRPLGRTDPHCASDPTVPQVP
jgi:hypothetical protein